MPDVWLVLWLVVGVVLVVAELFTTTFVLLMLAAGAFAAAADGRARTSARSARAIVFAVVSALALFGVRPALRRHLKGCEHDTPMGLDAIEGSTCLVVEDIDEDHGHGENRR